MTFEEYMESMFSADMESRQYGYEDMQQVCKTAQRETAKRCIEMINADYIKGNGLLKVHLERKIKEEFLDG